MAQSEDAEERSKAEKQLRNNFANLPDKKQAWSDLIQLTQDKDFGVKIMAAIALGSAFPCVPNKNQAWSDLIRLVQGEDTIVKFVAAFTLYKAFPCITDKSRVWADLHRLAQNEDEVVKLGTTIALGSVFNQIPDKNQAYADLHKLMRDGESSVRGVTAISLGLAFPYVPDKNQAWTDLLQLTQDKDSNVRTSAAGALGLAFPHIPDKELAWKYLQQLTQDEDSNVRSKAYYSNGRINILKGSEIDDSQKIKKYLDIAIENFDNSIKEQPERNPALFCSPFYKSYTIVLFEPKLSEVAIKNFIEEAKKASEDSESKVELLEAIENLVTALKEVDSYKNLNEQKRNLKTYVKYLDRTAEIIEKHKGKMPILCSLLERGVKVTEERINILILEIQNKAKKACQQSKGTPVEEIACAVNKEVQGWYVGNQTQMARYVENIIFSIKSKIPFTSENRHIYDKIEELRKEKDITKQYEMLPILIALIPSASIHVGDSITVSGVTASGENIQVVNKGNENKNISESISSEVEEQSWIKWLNSPATFAALIGFLATEIGTYFYPTTYNHLISVVIAVLAFVIVAIFDKRGRPQSKTSFLRAEQSKKY